MTKVVSLSFKALFLIQALLISQTVSAQNTFAVDCTSTYLYRKNGDSTTPPLKIRLSDYGLAAGDQIELKESGFFSQLNPPDNTNTMSGVFSRDGVYLANQFPHQVPNAIKAGPGVITENTWWGNIKTDIPEDFSILPSGTTLVIPSGALYLFVGVDDNLYYDNSTQNGIWVTISLLGKGSGAGKNRLTAILPPSANLRSGATAISPKGVVSGWVGPTDSTIRYAAHFSFNTSAYRYINVFNSGNSVATGVSPDGTVYGTYTYSTGNNAGWSRPFAMKGTTTSILFNGYGMPTAMNAAGDIAGSYISNYVLFPATIQKGITHVIDTNNVTAEATGINANGDVVGFFPNVPGGWIAVGGTATPTAVAISPPAPKIKIYPMAINNKGVIAGNYIKVTNGNLNNYLIRGFIYDTVHGYRDIGTLPGGTSVEVTGLNNLGMIVGSALTSEGATHAFVFNGVKMIDLGTLDGNASYATGINDIGEVVGVALDASGNENAFKCRVSKR